MRNYQPSARSKIIRSPQRASYDKAALYDILDAGYLCHIAYLFEGDPVIIPTAYVRMDDTLYIHGATKNRMMNNILEQKQTCVTVTHLDGLVLARSAFHHSFNYRSAVIFVSPTRVETGQEKTRALEKFTNHVIPGRWDEVRPPTAKELQSTLVLGIAIDEFSVKSRSGHPVDDEADYDLPVWAGVLPVTHQYGQPIADNRLKQGISLSDSIVKLKK